MEHFAIVLQGGPFHGQRKVVDGTGLPQEVIYDTEDGVHHHYVSTGGGVSVNSPNTVWSYKYVPEDAQDAQ